MSLQPIIIQAATLGALADLCISKGLITAAEGFPTASGVTISVVGEANLASGPQNAQKLAGVYALVSIDTDPDMFNGDAAAVLADLTANHAYTGAPLRVFAGTAQYAPDMNQRIDRTALRLRTSFRTTGNNWYPYLDDAGDPLMGTYAAWVALGAGIVAANVRVTQMDGSSQAVTQARALEILTAAVTNLDLWRTRAKSAKAAYAANPASWRMRDANWPAVYEVA